MLIDNADIYGDLVFQQTAQSQFLEGYSDADSAYDKY